MFCQDGSAQLLPGGGVLPLLVPCWLKHPSVFCRGAGTVLAVGAAWGWPEPQEADAAAFGDSFMAARSVAGLGRFGFGFLF